MNLLNLLEEVDARYPGDDTENVQNIDIQDWIGGIKQSNVSKLRDYIAHARTKGYYESLEMLKQAKEKYKEFQKALQMVEDDMAELRKQIQQEKKKTSKVGKEVVSGVLKNKEYHPLKDFTKEVTNNFKEPEFNSKLKSILSTTLDLNLAKTRLRYVHRSSEAEGEMGISLFVKPNENQAEMKKYYLINNLDMKQNFQK